MMTIWRFGRRLHWYGILRVWEIRDLREREGEREGELRFFRECVVNAKSRVELNKEKSYSWAIDLSHPFNVLRMSRF